jgi:hypothetical protein
MTSGVLPTASVMLLRIVAKTVFLPETMGVGRQGEGRENIANDSLEQVDGQGLAG